MRPKEFNKLLELPISLNSNQFRRLNEKIKAIKSDQIVSINIETNQEYLLCP